MKSNTRISQITIALALAAAAIITGCNGASSAPPPPPPLAISVTITPSGAQTIDQGQSKNFTATVSNDSGSKGVAWALTQNGAACSPACGSLSSTSTASGAATTYTAPAVVNANLQFTVTATSVADNTKSASDGTTVAPPPALNNPAQLPAATVGQPYSYTLTETGGVPPFTWTVTTGALPGGLNLNGSTGVISGTPNVVAAAMERESKMISQPLTVTTANFTVQLADSGNPQLITTQALSMPLSPAAVPPSITTQPANQTVVVGQTATFNVVATGTAPLSYQWQKNSVSISGATSSSFTTPATTAADNGANYKVVVSNSAGSVTSNAATLTVNAAPPQNIILAPGNLPSIDDAGDTIVVGNTTDARVFVKGGAGGWTQATQLNNTDGTVVSVSISGDGSTVVVGSCVIATCTGHAFVYMRPSAWNASPAMSPTATLSASDGLVGDRIGISVSTDRTGDTVAVGAPCGITALIPPQCGSVYVFLRPGSGNWISATQSAKLTAVNFLGISVSLNSAGDTIAAGATNLNFATPGAIYIFQQTGGAWTGPSGPVAPVATLTTSDGANGAELGRSVSISSNGDTVVGGASSSLYNPSTQQSGPGAAYVFVKPSGGWSTQPTKTENAKLTASDGQPSDSFGASVSISGDGGNVVVGAFGNPFNLGTHLPGPGATYVYGRPGGGWATGTETKKLLAFNGQVNGSGPIVTPAGGFGGAVAISKNSGLIAVGGSIPPMSSTTLQPVVFLF